ncbi:MAG: hypothetical protein F4X97_11320 [Boseongicola sp. SB0662_bin_57]|nr:hypothetical protein [Boseongicola sp. SB0662_bin_57]
MARADEERLRDVECRMAPKVRFGQFARRLGTGSRRSDMSGFNRFGEPVRSVSKGRGHGVQMKMERLARTVRRIPEVMFEA